MKSDHLRTSGDAALRGSFSLMQRAQSSAVFFGVSVYSYKSIKEGLHSKIVDLL
jgi:hypothetical protein